MEGLLKIGAGLLFLLPLSLGIWSLFRCSAGDFFFPEAQKRDQKGEKQVVFLYLSFGLLCGIVMAIAAHWQFPDQSLPQALDSFFRYNIDAGHYADLARWGYGSGEAGFPEQYLMIVFFPLFPMLMMPLVHMGLPFSLTAMGVNLLFLAGAGGELYRLMYRRFGRPCAWGSCLCLLLLPGSFLLVVPMTEAMFLFLSLAYLDSAERKKGGWCGLWGVLAGLCRLPGILLAVIPLCQAVRLWRQRERLPKGMIPAIAAPAVGFVVYLLLNWGIYGNPWQFLIFQRDHWYQGGGYFGNTLYTLLQYTGITWGENRDMAVYLFLWQFLAVLFQLLLLAAAARKLPCVWLLHGLLYFAVVNGAVWLLSAPRYALGMPVLAPAFALLVQRPWQRVGLILLLLPLWVLYFSVFLRHGPVY